MIIYSATKQESREEVRDWVLSVSGQVGRSNIAN